jgi:hypothetical protein
MFGRINGVSPFALFDFEMFGEFDLLCFSVLVDLASNRFENFRVFIQREELSALTCFTVFFYCVFESIPRYCLVFFPGRDS